MIYNILDKKMSVLNAALQLISEQGFNGTTMSQIAKCANSSVGTIYHYFAGKEELLNELFFDVKKRQSDYVNQDFLNNIRIQDGFKVFCVSIIRFSLEYPIEVSFMDQYENSPLITTETKNKCRFMENIINNLLIRAKEENILKNIPFHILNALILGAILSLTKKVTTNTIGIENNTNLDLAINAIWDMCSCSVYH